MWTFTTMLFYSAMQNSSKTRPRRWQKVDKIKTINKFKDYVQSVLLRTNTSSNLSLLRHWSIAMLTVDCSRPQQTSKQPLLQFVDGLDFPLVYTTLHDSTDLVINWIEIWTVWRPQMWRNEVCYFSTQNLHSFMWTFTLVLVLEGNIATKLCYSWKFFHSCYEPFLSDSDTERILTRSQAVARIADRTAKNCRWSRDLGHAHFLWEIFVRLLVILHTKLCTKFEVSSSSSFGDMFDHMPKILGVTWLRPRPL